MGNRIINLGGGTYNANIEGDYIQGSQPKEKPMKSAEPKDVKDTEGENINTNGENYNENIEGKVIKGDYRA